MIPSSNERRRKRMHLFDKHVFAGRVRKCISELPAYGKADVR